MASSLHRRQVQSPLFSPKIRENEPRGGPRPGRQRRHRGAAAGHDRRGARSEGCGCHFRAEREGGGKGKRKRERKKKRGLQGRWTGAPTEVTTKLGSKGARPGLVFFSFHLLLLLLEGGGGWHVFSFSVAIFVFLVLQGFSAERKRAHPGVAKRSVRRGRGEKKNARQTFAPSFFFLPSSSSHLAAAEPRRPGRAEGARDVEDPLNLSIWGFRCVRGVEKRSQISSFFCSSLSLLSLSHWLHFLFLSLPLFLFFSPRRPDRRPPSPASRIRRGLTTHSEHRSRRRSRSSRRGRGPTPPPGAHPLPLRRRRRRRQRPRRPLRRRRCRSRLRCPSARHRGT